MIRKCTASDFEVIGEVVNDAAQAYKGFIPADCWKDPYMPFEELKNEIEAGIIFWGFEGEGRLLGVMGIQEKEDVTLIRHAYVRTIAQKRGIGAALLRHLEALAEKPILIGTWAAAYWAIAFYKRHGYLPVSQEEKNRLLKRYWSVPERQIETSVVLSKGLI